MSSDSLCISTWFYSELDGEESNYPQVDGKSSSTQFQLIYWQCIIVYFASSVRHNPTAKHILFTNLTQIPNIGTFDTKNFLTSLDVEIVNLPLTYKTPVGYFGFWRCQFYIFDILKHLSKSDRKIDNYIVLDSDCVWIKPADKIAADIEKHRLLTYSIDYPTEYAINGLTRLDLKKIYEELDNCSLDYIPAYFGGEWFAANIEEIDKISTEFEYLWQRLLAKFENRQLKLNEEAHCLSYLYHKLGYGSGTANPYIDRIWTSSNCYTATDDNLILYVLHVPAEKEYGLRRLFNQVRIRDSRFWKVSLGEEFTHYIAHYLGIPKRSSLKYLWDKFDNMLSRLRKKVTRWKINN